MRRFLFVVLAVTICAACTKAHVDDSTAMMSTDIPETIYVSLEDDTRVQLDANGKTVWTAGDELTAFYRSDANSRFAFRGNTGDRNGGFTIAEQGDKTMDIDEIILLYPYSKEYKLDAENRCVDVKIPATQRYEDGSYGVGANLMASVETGDNFTLKSLCGWIAVQFKGAGKVMSVTLTGNNSEQLAGDAQLNYDTLDLELLYYPGAPDDDTQVGGSLIFGDYQQTITLDCGDGVELHYTEPTEFYFVVAPQTFANGITIEATCSDGTILTKSSSNALTVERNHIVPMSPLTVMEDIPDNQIWYISTDGNIVEPNNKTAFGATLISNVYKNGKGVMTFEGAVTEIGAGAFDECSTLSNITIPENVETIGDYAFAGCSSLANLIIPDSVTAIGEGVFYECSSLTSLTIPNGVTAIANYTFAYCDNLISVNIPDNVTSIGAHSFVFCSNLKSIIIPDNVTSIGNQAFDSCTSLTDVTMGKNVSAIGGLAFFGCSSLSSITIPDNVTRIEHYTFAGCENLANVTIPDSVTVIDEAAFDGCTSFTSMTIPNSVISIGDWAFSLCYNIENVKIGNNVTTIGDYAFEQCGSLTSVTIPNSVTTIGKSVFENCFKLQKFNGKFASDDGCCLIADGTLKAYAIDCGLEEYTIPDSVVKIGEDAFRYCYDIMKVTIPDSVTSIGDYAFLNCTSLTNVYCEPTTPPAGSNNMFSTHAGLKIYVPTESVEIYKEADGWKDYADYIVSDISLQRFTH